MVHSLKTPYLVKGPNGPRKKRLMYLACGLLRLLAGAGVLVCGAFQASDQSRPESALDWRTSVGWKTILSITVAMINGLTFLGAAAAEIWIFVKTPDRMSTKRFANSGAREAAARLVSHRRRRSTQNLTQHLSGNLRPNLSQNPSRNVSQSINRNEGEGEAPVEAGTVGGEEVGEDNDEASPLRGTERRLSQTRRSLFASQRETSTRTRAENRFITVHKYGVYLNRWLLTGGLLMAAAGSWPMTTWRADAITGSADIRNYVASNAPWHTDADINGITADRDVEDRQMESLRRLGEGDTDGAAMEGSEAKMEKSGYSDVVIRSTLFGLQMVGVFSGLLTAYLWMSKGFIFYNFLGCSRVFLGAFIFGVAIRYIDAVQSFRKGQDKGFDILPPQTADTVMLFFTLILANGIGGSVFSILSGFFSMAVSWRRSRYWMILDAGVIIVGVLSLLATFSSTFWLEEIHSLFCSRQNDQVLFPRKVVAGVPQNFAATLCKAFSFHAHMTYQFWITASSVLMSLFQFFLSLALLFVKKAQPKEWALAQKFIIAKVRAQTVLEALQSPPPTPQRWPSPGPSRRNSRSPSPRVQTPKAFILSSGVAETNASKRSHYQNQNTLNSTTFTPTG